MPKIKINPTIPVHVQSVVFLTPFGHGKSYIPKGQVFDVIEHRCSTHKKCKCPKQVYAQTIIKKSRTARGVPLAIRFPSLDEALDQLFQFARTTYAYPVSFENWEPTDNTGRASC